MFVQSRSDPEVLSSSSSSSSWQPGLSLHSGSYICKLFVVALFGLACLGKANASFVLLQRPSAPPRPSYTTKSHVTFQIKTV